MRRGKRIGITLVLLASMLFLSIPMDVAAVTPYFDVTINFADYGDLNGEGEDNDVLILFTCVIGDGQKSPQESDFLFTLILPSGQTFYALITVIGKYREIRLALFWYEVAIESGWYALQLDAFGYGIKGGYDYDDYVFDPPSGGGPADPTISVSFW